MIRALLVVPFFATAYFPSRCNKNEIFWVISKNHNNIQKITAIRQFLFKITYKAQNTRASYMINLDHNITKKYYFCSLLQLWKEISFQVGLFACTSPKTNNKETQGQCQRPPAKLVSKNHFHIFGGRCLQHPFSVKVQLQ